MAITRAQQFRQMLIKGGVANPDGRRGFFQGALKDAKEKNKPISPGTSVGGNTRGGTGKGRDLDVQQRGMTKSEYNRRVAEGTIDPYRGSDDPPKPPQLREDKSFVPTPVPKGISPIERFRNEQINKAIKRNRVLALRKLGLLPEPSISPIGAIIQSFEQIPEEFELMSEEDLLKIATSGPYLSQQKTVGDVNRFTSGKDLLGKTFEAEDILRKGDMTQGKFEELFPGPTPPPDDRGPDQQEGDPCKGPNPPAYCFVGGNVPPPSDDDQDPTGGMAFRFMSRGGSPMDPPKEGIMQMASAPDPMDTRNDMMENLAIDNFGKPLKDLTEDEIIQIEEMMMEMDQYGSKPTSRSNKMMADLDIKSMIDDALEQMSQTRFGKSYDELDPLEKELILEIIRGVGKDVFGERQMPESDRAMAQEGGIMDLETGRQMYFLGKLVKKATRAVKKITKSPLGKAAILGGLAYFGGGAGAGKLGSFFGKGSFNPLKAISTVSGLAGPRQQTGLSGLGRILNKLGLADTAGGLTMFGKFGIPLALLPFLTEEEQEQIASDRGKGLDIPYIRNNPYTFASQVGAGGSGMATAFLADGGRIGYQEGSKEPVAKKTMPLLDMGGKEMDLRDDGGFVPIGRMEKADDVPARLSKNEFVFTADAVRNAGGGDVDKGAEVMYNMMKNLESGGEVSEESQGLEGAREMFQTSKRLEEVL